MRHLCYCPILGLALLSSTSCRPRTYHGSAPLDLELAAGELEYGHFEVGSVNPMGRCTGTLVAPRVFLTASHCLPTPNSSHAPGPTFFVLGQPFPSHGWRSLGDTTMLACIQRGKSPMECAVGERADEHDFALVRLDTEVPASLAVSAALATHEMSPGERGTLVGFGCIDIHDREAGRGTKRRHVYVHGNSRSVCEGDSGGPVFNSAGEIVYSVSLGEGDGAIPDRFARIAHFREEALRFINELSR